MYRLSVIIAAYRHLSLLAELLASIAEHNDIGDGLEVIVVDNSPDDEIAKHIASASYPFELRYVPSGGNFGYGRANNIGAALARADKFVFLNPDTKLVGALFGAALADFDKYDMFGVQLLTEDGGRNYSFRCNMPYTLRAAVANRLIKITGRFNPRKHYIVGADIFITRQAFEDGGRFDENIFMYNEEFDLSSRVLAKGYSIGFDGRLTLVHAEGSGEYGGSDAEVRRRALQSFCYVCEKLGVDYMPELRRQHRFVKLRLAAARLLCRDTVGLMKLLKLYDEKTGRDNGK